MTSTNEYKFQTVVTIPLSEEERDNQTINKEHAAAAVAAMYRDGIVVLENAVNIEHVNTLNQILTSEAETLAALPTTISSTSRPQTARQSYGLDHTMTLPMPTTRTALELSMKVN